MLPVDIFVVVDGRRLDADVGPVDACHHGGESCQPEELRLLPVGLLLRRQLHGLMHTSEQSVGHTVDGSGCGSLVDADGLSHQVLETTCRNDTITCRAAGK